MAKPRTDFAKVTTLQADDIFPIVRNLGAGTYGERHIEKGDLENELAPADPFDPNERLVRQVIFRTGATADLMGESASTGGTGSVTYSAADADQPGGVNYATGGALNNAFGANSVAQHKTGAPAIDFEILFRVVDLTACRIWLGVASTAHTNFAGSDAPGATFHLAALRFSTNVPDTNWQIYTGNASAGTVTDGGAAPTAGLHRARFAFTGNGAALQVYLNGAALGGSITTTLPGTTTALQMFIGITTLAAAVKNIRLFRFLSGAQYW